MRKHKRCRGIRLWKWGRFQIELWWFPQSEEIEPHVHKHIDSNIVLLYGVMSGNIGGQNGFPRTWKGYPVPAGVIHSAKAYTNCIFINIERWTSDDVTSAAVDFTAV